MPTALITGATNGIGLETARVLARMGYSVLIHGRDPRKGEAAVQAVSAQGNGGAADRDPRTAGGIEGDADRPARVQFVQADFGSLAQVRRMAAEVASSVPRLDVLINNAGCANFSRSVTADGFETTLAVNHLAPFLLTNLLLDKMRASAPARIVNVASRAHRYQTIDFDDLMSTRGYKVMRTYGRSKLANILFTRALARRLEGSGVTANCLHPGLVDTGIGQNNLFGRIVGRIVFAVTGITVEEGAKTSIYLATSPDVEGESGGYFTKCEPASLLTSPEAVTDTVAQRLWEVSEQLVGLPCTSS